MIAPIFEKMSAENPDVEFVKVDVDEADEVAAGA
jgi:thioredoxin 1